MRVKKIGETVRWHVEGTLDEYEEGIVFALLKCPVLGVRGYSVKPDNPNVIGAVVPIERVVEHD